MKCWKSVFNAQGWKLIIVASQVGAVMEALKKMKRHGETRFITKIAVPPPLNANLLYFFECHPIYDQIKGSSVVFITL
jgi:hypothetical protein